MKNKVTNVLARFKKSKDSKVLASNFGYMMLLQITSYVFPLITIPYLATVIGVEGFGKIAFAAAIIIWFQTITEWGFNYTATRDVARNRDNIDKVSEIFSAVLWAKLFLGLVSFIILCTLIFFVPILNENKDVILLTFLLVPGNIIFPTWFFQAIERMRYITIFNILIKTAFTILVFVFVTNESDYIIPPLLTSLGYLVSGFSALYLIVRKWKVRITRPNVSKVIKYIIKSKDVFLNTLAPNLYNSFSVVTLGFMGGATSNGLLDAGSKISNIVQQLLNVVSRVFFPFLSRKIGKHSLYATGALVFSFVSAVSLFFMSPYLIELFFNDDFFESILVMKIMSISIMFSALNMVYGTNYLVLRGKEKELRNITLVCSLVGFVSAIPLIYFYDFIGAALNILFARGLLGLGVARAALRNMKLKQ